MISQHSVAFGYCHNGMVSEGFSASHKAAHKADLFDRQLLAEEIKAVGPYIPQNRETIAKEFMRTEREWFLSLDNDIKFTLQEIYQLADAADAEERPIVGGLYLTTLYAAREEDKRIWPVLLKDEGEGRYIPFTDAEFGDVKDVDACGMGFTLIHRRVFEGMFAYPESDDPWSWFGHDLSPDGKERYGEDVTFCRRAKACGFPIYGHFGTKLRHPKMFDLRSEDYRSVIEGGKLTLM